MFHRTFIVFVAFLLTASCFLFAPPASEKRDAPAFDEFIMDGRPSREDAIVQDLSGMPDTRAFTVPSTANQRIIKNIMDNVSQEQLYSYVLKLQNFGSRVYRAPGGFNSSIWLHDVLKGNGRLQVGYHNFTVDRGALGVFTLSNVILTLPGVNASSGRTYYVFAHHDSAQYQDMNQILTNAPGADDDASGCAAVLEAARVMSQYTFQDTIRFCCFNAEEIGLYGSYFWAKNMSEAKEDCRGSLCFDMIGYSSGTLPQDLDLWYNAANLSFAQYLNNVNSRYKIGLSILNAQTASAIPSDIQSFYDYKFPCVMGIEEDWSPVYHTMQDTIGYMNFTLVTKTTKLAVASLSEMGRLLYTDLTIKPGNMSVNRTMPIVGDKVNVSVNVSNTGNLKALNCEVVFSDNGMQFASKRMDVAANGTNKTFAVWTASEGTHNITVSVDPKNEIVESVESNNSAYKHVNVNDKPVARLFVSPLGDIPAYQNVILNASFSTDDIGGITYYNYSFGDGNSTGWVTSNVTNKGYTDDGNYTVTLQVKDYYGAVSNIIKTNITVLNAIPHAQCSAYPTSALTGVPIYFHDQSTDWDGYIVSYYWDFGDGTNSTEKNPVHVYTRSFHPHDPYEVHLKVVDDDGGWELTGISIFIEDRPPIAKILCNQTIGNITTVFDLMSNVSDPDTVNPFVMWDLGDGNLSYYRNITHTYAKPGTYNVILSVSDNASKITDIITITVINVPPTAIASVFPNTTYTLEKIIFSGGGSDPEGGPLTFIWNFGDGNVSLDSNTVHTYARPGVYYPTLTVLDPYGANSTLILTVEVLNWLPIPSLRVLGNRTVNGTVVFDASNSSDIEGPFDPLMDYGDNTTGKGLVTTHVYKAPGNYTVKLTLTDIDGGRSYWETVVYIKPAPKPKPADTTTPPVNQTVKEKIVEKTNWTAVTVLIVLVIILIILLVLAVVFAMMRGKKKEPPPENPPAQPPEQQPLQAPGQSPASEPAVATGAAGQPQNAPPQTAAPAQPLVQSKPPMQTVPPSNQQALPPAK